MKLFPVKLELLPTSKERGVQQLQQEKQGRKNSEMFFGVFKQ